MKSTPLGETLHNLMHAYKARLRETVIEQQIPLPITHIRVLKGICRNKTCTAGVVAQRMQRDKAQITRVLNELLGEGLITKLDNPNDGRSQILQPTAKGLSLMAQLNKIEAKTIALAAGTLDTNELDSFIRLARIMIDNLESGKPTNSGENTHD